MSEIKAVLFDFGGVFTGSPFTAVESMTEELGAKPGQLLELVFGSYGKDEDHPWHQVERGEISLEKTRDLILDLGRREGLEVDIYQMFGRMSEQPDAGLREVLVERTRGLRDEGFATAIVTNNIAEIRDSWRSLLPVDELFDLVIDSSEVGLRKPDQKIFELTLQRLGGLAAEQAVFLDDFEANVQAAQQLGLKGVHVGPAIEPAIAELDALLLQGN